MPEKIYFDYNVINYLRQSSNEKLNEKFAGLDEQSLIVFSPAHLEEIAVSEKRDKVSLDIIKKEIDFLTKIARNNSLRAITREKFVLFDEYPEDCYKRVLESYDLNDIAENIDEHVIRDANENPANNPKEVNNIDPSLILSHITHREFISRSLANAGIIDHSEMVNCLRWNFDDLENRFCVFESYVNIAANILEKLGYFREKKDKSRSRLHDVSHIIYAAYCDVFVSADKKLLNKTKAIYSMLNVHTKVLSLNDFVNHKHCT